VGVTPVKAMVAPAEHMTAATINAEIIFGFIVFMPNKYRSGRYKTNDQNSLSKK
jgi:hypothetical protein